MLYRCSSNTKQASGFDGTLIATSNSNSIIMGQSGGKLGKETSVTFEPSNISAIITCGASLNDGGGTAGLNEYYLQPKVYATKEGTTAEVECTWNDTRKCYEVPDTTVKYTKVRAYVYGFSGSKSVYVIVGCLYVFGK